MQDLYWIRHSYKFRNVSGIRIWGKINFPGFPELSHKYTLMGHRRIIWFYLLYNISTICFISLPFISVVETWFMWWSILNIISSFANILCLVLWLICSHNSAVVRVSCPISPAHYFNMDQIFSAYFTKYFQHTTRKCPISLAHYFNMDQIFSANFAKYFEHTPRKCPI